MPESNSANFASASRVQIQWGVRIPMGDGTRLGATLYLPSADVLPVPALFTLTPYIGQKYHEEAMYFAAHGYAFVTVDVRGRGDSDGVFTPLRRSGEEGRDIVRWLSDQPFCSGEVGMWGGSYGGHAQWLTAAEGPAALKCIAPVASPYVGVDFPMRNNVFFPYLIQWLVLVSGRAAQDNVFADQARLWSSRFAEWLEAGLPFNQLDRFSGYPSPIFQEWIAHPEQDTYWDSYNPTVEGYRKIRMPVLTLTGIYDGDQPGALMHYRQHVEAAEQDVAESHYLVIGPWDHAGARQPRPDVGGLKLGSAAMLDLRNLHREWFDWVLRGASRPEFLKDRVAYYVLGSERWRYAHTLEAVTSRYQTLFLSSLGEASDVFHSGSLGEVLSPSNVPDEYVYDPRSTEHVPVERTIDPECLVDERLVQLGRGRHLVYHSMPFASDQEVAGFFRLTAWISIDQPDSDFRASVYEIADDGRSLLLSSDWIRSRYRESPREAKLIRTTEPLRYEFQRFPFVARLISRGSRLRLIIGPINSIHSQKNFNAGGIVSDESMQDARSVRVRLFHDSEHPSALHVPIAVPED